MRGSGERLHGMQEVSGSIPLFSTKKGTVLRRKYGAFLFAEADFWGCIASPAPFSGFCRRFRYNPQRLTLHRFQTGKRFEPSIRKKRKILIPTWVYSCCVRHEENRSENCRIVFLQMGVSRMGYGYCNIMYGQIRQKSLIFFVYL
ncbi:MAG: hypothetical protein KH269_12515 [Faecalibacterium prausnitzii]|nr:hypothetical protein [Faecalibacterium prausnitzii]